MATETEAPPLYAATINAVKQYLWPEATHGVVGRWIYHLTASSVVGGSITVKGRAAGSGNTFVPIPYRRRYLNGAVGDDTSVTTAITDTSLIDVDATGLDICLDCTAITSGSWDVRATKVEG